MECVHLRAFRSPCLSARDFCHPSPITKTRKLTRTEEDLHTTMASSSSIHPSLLGEDGSMSDATSAHEDEKTIPFLRRLRDMLLENEDAISFASGERRNGKTSLGRIIVHDRIRVETKVLPKYFNHSCFASLRRQLNYFSFVRLGKGRQRESTYVNENVVELKDILHLKRRSAGHTAPPLEEAVTKGHLKHRISDGDSDDLADCVASSELVVKPHEQSKGFPTRHRSKRRRTNKRTPVNTMLPRVFSPINHISEDERSEAKQYFALDLTKPTGEADDEILAGCNALLELAGHGWN